MNQTEKVVAQLVNRFEKEIRQDQDKITRHACAENVSKIDDLSEVITRGAGDLFQNNIHPIAGGPSFKDKAHAAIINTKAL